MAIDGLKLNASTKRLMAMRTEFENLQRQLATGRKAETYGGLGFERSISVNFRGRISDIDTYSASISQLTLRSKILDTALTRLSDIPLDIRSGIDPNSFEVRDGGRTDAQKTALIALDEMVGLLNSDIDGRYLMAGKTTDVKPVVDADVILNGVGGQAGLKQVVAERLTADNGTGGQGRLAVGRTTSTVNLTRERPLPDEFGLKISNVQTLSSAVSITNTPVTVGPDTFVASSAIAFTAQPSVGDTITVNLVNPDGSTAALTLRATVTSPPGKDEFTIGATVDDTAASFETQFGAVLDRHVATDFRAASAARAAETFFSTSGGAAPKRVDATSGGGTLATATSLRNGTATDTVSWYKGYNAPVVSGDISTYPRSDASVKVDSSIEVSYGIRANEDAFRVTVQSLALAAVSTFDASVSTDADRYRAMMERARDGLAFKGGGQKPSDIHADIALAAKVATDTSSRHKVNKVAMADLVAGVEQVSKEEVAAKILTLQTQMQASYQTTSILNELSLLNFL